MLYSMCVLRLLLICTKTRKMYPHGPGLKVETFWFHILQKEAPGEPMQLHSDFSLLVIVYYVLRFSHISVPCLMKHRYECKIAMQIFLYKFVFIVGISTKHGGDCFSMPHPVAGLNSDCMAHKQGEICSGDREFPQEVDRVFECRK